MDRVEQLTASPTEAAPPQLTGESATQQQSPQGPTPAPQASGSGAQQLGQPPQPSALRITRTPPPPPAKSDSDRAFRASASRPLSFTTAEGPQEGPSGLQAGLASPRDAPMRRSSVPVGQSQAPSMTRGRDGYGVGGTYRLAEAPRQPLVRGQSTANQDWMLPETRAVNTVVSMTLLRRVRYADSSQAPRQDCGRAHTAHPRSRPQRQSEV